MSSISVGSYKNRQDINEKLRVYKQNLDLQSQLAQRQEEANKQAYKLQGQPIPATEMPKYASYEEELADRSGQLQQMMMTLQKIFKYPKDAKISLDKFTEAGYTPADFNRYAGEFMDILKNTKGLTPQFFMTNWDRFWTRAQSRDDGLIDIGVYDPKSKVGIKLLMDKYVRELIRYEDPLVAQDVRKIATKLLDDEKQKEIITPLLLSYNNPANEQPEQEAQRLNDIIYKIYDDREKTKELVRKWANLTARGEEVSAQQKRYRDSIGEELLAINPFIYTEEEVNELKNEELDAAARELMREMRTPFLEELKGKQQRQQQQQEEEEEEEEKQTPTSSRRSSEKEYFSFQEPKSVEEKVVDIVRTGKIRGNDKGLFLKGQPPELWDELKTLYLEEHPKRKQVSNRSLASWIENIVQSIQQVKEEQVEVKEITEQQKSDFLGIMDTMKKYQRGKKINQFKPYAEQENTEKLYPYMKLFSAERLPERYGQNTKTKKTELWQTLINEYNRIEQEQLQLREQQGIQVEMGKPLPILQRPPVKEEKELEPLTDEETRAYNQLENALANERNWDDTGAYTGSKGKITEWLNLLGYERTKFDNDTLNVGQRQALRSAFENFTKKQQGQGLYFNIPKTTRQYIHQQSSGGVIQPIHHKTTRHFIIGRGIELEPQERFVKFGSYLIHKPMLYNQNRLSLKFPSKVGVKEFPSQILSNELADLLKFILENQKIDIKLFNDLNKKDRDLFHHLITRARLDQQLGMMGYKDEETEKDFKRFELLRGEVLAGNNNYDLLKELRQLILNFMATNKMRKSEGNQILYEINSILVH